MAAVFEGPRSLTPAVRPADQLEMPVCHGCDRLLGELAAAYQPKADELCLARIAKEREEAGRKLALTRDIVAWQVTMTRLDAAEALARQPLDAPRLTRSRSSTTCARCPPCGPTQGLTGGR
jgi:hypothetical protein